MRDIGNALLCVWRCVGLALCLAGASAWGAKRDGRDAQACGTRCDERQTRCRDMAKLLADRCVRGADRWKEKQDKKDELSRRVERARNATQARYDKMRKACDLRQQRSVARCTTEQERCSKACDRHARKGGTR